MELIANHRIDRTVLKGKEKKPTPVTHEKGDKFECENAEEANRLIKVGAAKKPKAPKEGEGKTTSTKASGDSKSA